MRKKILVTMSFLYRFYGQTCVRFWGKASIGFETKGMLHFERRLALRLIDRKIQKRKWKIEENVSRPSSVRRLIIWLPSMLYHLPKEFDILPSLIFSSPHKESVVHPLSINRAECYNRTIRQRNLIHLQVIINRRRSKSCEDNISRWT
jgi:hypothetical protein